MTNKQTGEIISDPTPFFAGDIPYGMLPPQQALLRYMDLWKFEDLFKTQELYFCRTDKLQDPLEGSLSKQAVRGTSQSGQAFRKDIHLENDTYKKAFEYRKIAKGCTFINCWHINTVESHQMWEEYTTSPDSVIIVTTVQRLLASLSVRVFPSTVKYVPEDFPRTEFDERSLFFYKDVAFAFEQEFRLLLDLFHTGGSIRPDHPDDFYRRVPINLSTLVHYIQPNPLASKDALDRVSKLVKEFLPSAQGKATDYEHN